MYLGGDKYIRKDKLVAGDPVLEAGEEAGSEETPRE
jgi:hypothetical protein